MDKEQKYLIELTKSFIYNEKPHLSNEIDYSKLFSYADSHNLLGVIYCTVNSAENKSIIPPELFSAVQEKFFNIIYISNLQMQIYEEIKAAFAAAEIRFVPFKGIVLRRIYPFPESRIMGDIDVLIDYNNRIPAKEALKNAGFVCKDSNGPVWNYTKNSVLIEVHTSILNGKVGNSSSPEYFKNAVDKAEFNGFEGSLPDQYHFEYLIAHTAHHFWFFGAGIKLILDLALMIKNKSINIYQAVDDLSSCGLGEFSKNILTVCFKWYEAGTDFKYDISKTESFLVSYGAFGTKGRNSAAVVARKDLEEGKKSHGIIISELRLLFPPYRKMKEIPYIKFIENRPYLTPYAWIYRFIYNIKNKKNYMLDTAKHIGSKETESEAQKELDYFKEIGLL